MSSSELKITAQPLLNPEVCIFTIDRPIYSGGSFDCKNAAMASGSPLLEALFAIEGIREVFVSGDSLTIAKSSQENWQVMGKKVGDTIRSLINSGGPLFAAELKKPVLADDSIRDMIQELFDKEINPAISSHGGFVELVDVKGSQVYLRLTGGCQGCGAASITLKHGIEKAILTKVPEVTAVVDVTDHAAGVNPFY